MQIGLLWYDDDPRRALEEKVSQAAARYREKFGREPNVCYVHPTVMVHNEAKCGAVRVLAAPGILPHHFWLGVESAADKRKKAA
jgi:hypothetical protein